MSVLLEIRSPFVYSQPRTLIMDVGLMDSLTEVEDDGDGGGNCNLGAFEPQTRARSNTWPLPRPENFVDEVVAADGAEGGNKCVGPTGLPATTPLVNSVAKKNSSRRNAWGNLSYADLITQAITSSTESRLTLSQIYEWMVQNVPYFKDKGDSNSSAGWKNSIRHNLSLHNRFMRVQNEGTGKSSWWMINPDAKPGKSVRRRAASMETSKFEKRRGRVKKKVEMLRNGALPDTTLSPSSSVSESLDLFPESPIHSANGGFQLSPDFRPRASSNTSSCGRLSPIPAVVGVEPDWSSSSNQFNNSNANFDSSELSAVSYSPEQLAGNLEQSMKLHQTEVFLGFISSQGAHPLPSYTAPFEQFPGRRDISSLHATSPYGRTQCPIHRMHSCACMQVHIKTENMSPNSGMSPSYPHSPDTAILVGRSRGTSGASSPPHCPSTMMGQLMGALNTSACNTAAILDDLNINVESLQGGFDCNVEELIKHELSMEGSLDFNFSSQQQQLHMQQQQQEQQLQSVQQTCQEASEIGQPALQPPPPPSYSTSVSTPSWVH